jgi:Fe-S-cluster containining protein
MAERSRKSPPDGGPWYAEGLCFECRPDCGACCTNHEDYAYVYLEGDDVDRLVAHLEIDEEEFLLSYTELDECFLVLRMDSPDCPFLDGTRCSVYPARPTQCRTFPFWRETLRTPQKWAKLRKFCPGIDEGPRHPLEVIRARLAEREAGD